MAWHERRLCSSRIGAAISAEAAVADTVMKPPVTATDTTNGAGAKRWSAVQRTNGGEVLLLNRLPS